LGIFSKKEKPMPVYVVNGSPPEKKSFTQSLFGKREKKSGEAFSREWRVSCKVKRYGSFIIRARDKEEAENKLYKKIDDERLPNRYYWTMTEITME
jgi:hypothetical protein